MQQTVIEGFRLSPQQEHLLELDGFGSDACRAVARLELRGEVDGAALARALDAVVAAHEILRTTFRSLAGMARPLQVVAESAPELARHDLRDLDGEERRRRADELARALEEADFDLESGPLLRAALLRLDGESWELHLALPALAADLPTLRRMAGDLVTAYRRQREGAGAGDDDPPQYIDVAEWQREVLDSGEAPPPRLWEERSPGAALPFEAEGGAPFAPRRLPVALASVDGALAAEAPELLLAACWRVVLDRLTGGESVLAWVCDGRPQEELARVVGPLARPLPLRWRPAPGSTPRAAVGRLGEEVERLHRWQAHVPWEGSGSAPPASPPFSFEWAGERWTRSAAGVEFRFAAAAATVDRATAHLLCHRDEDVLGAILVYDASRMSHRDAGRLAGWLRHLASAAAARPDEPWSELEMLSAGERHRLTVELQGERRPRPSATLGELFAERAAAQPRRTALVDADGAAVTYGDLDRRSAALAARLAGLGVGPEVRVALHFERSVAMVVAILAVLRAGGAYVPLDRAHPAKRLRFMLEDAGARLLVADRAPLPELPTAEFPVVRLTAGGEPEDGEEDGEEVRDPAPPTAGPGAEGTAYVIYTSGSTGRPKGVAVSHDAILNRLLWMLDAGLVGAGDAVLQKTSYGFDASIWEIFAPLLAGGRVVLAEPGAEADAAVLLPAVEEHGVTVLQLVPSQLPGLLDQPGVEHRCRGLRRLFCGGEALAAQSVRWALDRLDVEMTNLYGPTECAIDATSHRCRGDETGGVVPIGRPLPNVQVHLLDAGGRSVPSGVVGELHVGGAGLARGYPGRAGLTAGRFVPDPLGAPGSRLYATGDLARRGDDGEITFLGRIDQQVKLRGLRIELGEIETLLQAHPSVRRAAVAVREVSGEPRLVAYVVGRRDALSPPADTPLHALPNGLRVAFINRNETDVVYREVFEDDAYLRHGIHIEDGDRVVDLGANVGLFTLSLCDRYRDLRVVAVEPIPAVFEALRANLDLYGVDARLHACAVGREEGEIELVYYPTWSTMSGAYADAAEERRISAAALRQRGFEAGEEAGEMLAERFAERRRLTRPVRTVSDLLREAGLDRVDLLKVDVEKAEEDVLAGIGEDDFRRIRQIVAEVHDDGGRLVRMRRALEARGYRVTVEEDPMLVGTGVVNLYAVAGWSDRRGDGGPAEALLPRPAVSDDELREMLAGRLPEYMVPATFVRLDALPRLPNGKLDRSALQTPETVGEGRRAPYVAPRTPGEELLATLWAGLLGVERVGVNDDFFDLGGHSLLATRLVSRLRQVFGVEVRVRTLFEAPTLGAMAQRVEEARRQATGASPPALEPVPRDGALPLSFAQQRLWFLDQLDSGSAAYNLPSAVRLRGPLSVPALAAALGHIRRRHESLRTTFPAREGRPAQVIHAAGDSVPLPLVDLRDLEPGRRQAVARRLAWEVCWHPFDLARGPLLRTALLRIDDDDHLVALAMHHIVGDGWSTGILVGELVALYRACRRGEAPALPELPVQYADYAVWQRRWLQGEVLEAHFDYWRRQLGDDPPRLQLPTDRPRSAVRHSRAAGSAFPLPPELVERVEGLGRTCGASLFMTLLSGLYALLFHYTRETDLSVGVPVAGRTRGEVEDLVGFFANTLVLRGELGGGPTVAGLLERVRDVALGAYAHQDLPFEKLVDELKPERRLDHTPLFQVMFMLQNVPMGRLELPGLEATGVPLESRDAKFDLLVSVEQAPEGLLGNVEYRRELFDATTVARMSGHLLNLLREMAADPGRRVSALSPLAPEERAQVVREWNDTAAPYDGEGRIEALFEARADAAPQRPAVVFPGGSWSYGELETRANRLAAALRSRGVGRGDLVAVLLHRRPEMISTLLAILKAGAAYVPLEADHPPVRLGRLLRSLDVRRAVTEAALLERLRQAGGGELLDYVVLVSGEAAGGGETGEDGWRLLGAAEIADQPADRPSGGGDGGDLAYVIFTSGSTGVPKGVMVRHRPVLNLLHWVNRRFAVDADDRVLFVTSLCFDLSVYDVFGLLAAGGSIRLAVEDELADPEELVRILVEEPISFWDSAPAALGRLTVAFPPPPTGGDAPRLRRVFLSGDWIPLALPGQVRAAFPRARVVALGGATEATVWSNFFVVGDLGRHWVSIPYGRPMPNARYHVLDPGLRLCPVNVEGDLHIGGECLFTAYAAAPRLNATKLLPDPFGGVAGGRLYRTGDRARFRPDGNIEFLGRADFQVKVRGFRVELGEVEAALVEHPAVRAAAVAAPDDGHGGRRLVAYPVIDGAPPTTSELRAFLLERVPEYMVPASFVPLDALPVTANGKLDRDALPDPDARRPDLEQGYAAPRGEAEGALARIWAAVLGVDRVGRDDNFFELGGDSILSIQIIAQARRHGLDLDPRDLFEHQTVAALAAAARAVEARPDSGPVTGPAPLLPAQRWFFDHHPADPHHFNQALLLAVDEALSTAALERAVAALLEHHDALRARFVRDADGWRQAIAAPGGPVPFTRVDLSALDDGRRRRSVESASGQAQAGFDLAAGPLLRALLFATGERGGQRLLLVAHHLVVDGVSWRLLLQDLALAYRQAAAGRRVELPPRSTSVRRWGSLLEERAGGPADDVEEPWRVAVDRPPAPLPRDRDGANPVSASRTVDVTLERAESRRLLEAAAALHTRVDAALLAALARAVEPWSGETALRVDLESHGRGGLGRDDGVDLSRTVGWLTVVRPFLVDPGDAGDGAAAVAVVDRALEAVQRGVVWSPPAERWDGTEPASEVLFNYLGRLDRGMDGDAPFRLAEESSGQARSPRQQRFHLLEVTAVVIDGRLRTSFTYGSEVHHSDTVEALAERYRTALEDLLRHGWDSEAVALARRFPLAGGPPDRLARLVAERAPVADVYPLSPLQEGLLFESLSDDEGGAYVAVHAFTVDGELDAAAFVETWRGAVERHPVLRTSFAWQGLPRPLQVVEDAVETTVEELDWSHLPAERRRERLRELWRREAESDLPLDRAPLFRLSLVRLGAASHRVVWSFHHLVLDGWSVPLLLDELLRIYRALVRGEEPALPAVPPFRDYVAWLEERDDRRSETFWRRHLAGLAAPSPLPGHGGSGAPGGGTAEVGAELDEAATAALVTAARSRKLTLATLMQGVWGILLAAAGGERDVLFGTVVSGRPPELEGVETMIGMFVNTLPVRLRLDGGERLGERLATLQGEWAEAQRLGHVSLRRLRRWSDVAADRSLFESILVVENYPREMGGDGDGELRIRDLRSTIRESQDLVVQVHPGSRLELRFRFDRRRLGEAEAGFWLDRLAALVAALPAELDEPVDAVLDGVEGSIRAARGDQRAVAESAGLSKLRRRRGRERREVGS